MANSVFFEAANVPKNGATAVSSSHGTVASGEAVPGTVTWQTLASQKRSRRDALFPPEWRLPSSYRLCPVPPTDVSYVGPYWLETPAGNITDVRGVAASCGLLTAEELAITAENDAATLVARIAAGEVTASAVTTAYCKRAAIAHQLVNCITEPLFERALARAAVLDAAFAKSGTLTGPLHGIPVSVKDQFDIEGVESTMGFVAGIGRVAAHTASLVTLLESLGAVVICRTNIPQALLCDESVNNVYGRTLNPHNLALTAGGSSGGEGALVACHGSLVGIGTDLGGSVRKPASFNGLYSLRPSARRLPYSGASNVFAGCEALESSIGPLARSHATVAYVMDALVGAAPWELDHSVVERPLAVPAPRPLRICIMADDGLVRPHPPLRRALATAAAALTSAGHTVRPWAPMDHARAQETVSRIFDADGGEDVRAWLGGSGEPFLPQVFTSQFPAMSLHESWQLNKARDAYRAAFHARWRDAPFDAILCPVAPHCAPRHLPGPRPAEYITYTTVWSLLDVPTYTLPVTTVDAEVDVKVGNYDALNAADQANYDEYSPKNYENAPVVLQLVHPLKHHEDDLLAVGQALDDALRSQKA